MRLMRFKRSRATIREDCKKQRGCATFNNLPIPQPAVYTFRTEYENPFNDKNQNLDLDLDEYENKSKEPKNTQVNLKANRKQDNSPVKKPQQNFQMESAINVDISSENLDKLNDIINEVKDDPQSNDKINKDILDGLEQQENNIANELAAEENKRKNNDLLVIDNTNNLIFEAHSDSIITVRMNVIDLLERVKQAEQKGEIEINNIVEPEINKQIKTLSDFIKSNNPTMNEEQEDAFDKVTNFAFANIK